MKFLFLVGAHKVRAKLDSERVTVQKLQQNTLFQVLIVIPSTFSVSLKALK